MQWISQIEQKFTIVIVVFLKIEVYSTLDDEKYAHIDPVLKNPAFSAVFSFKLPSVLDQFLWFEIISTANE